MIKHSKYATIWWFCSNWYESCFKMKFKVASSKNIFLTVILLPSVLNSSHTWHYMSNMEATFILPCWYHCEAYSLKMILLIITWPFLIAACFVPRRFSKGKAGSFKSWRKIWKDEKREGLCKDGTNVKNEENASHGEIEYQLLYFLRNINVSTIHFFMTVLIYYLYNLHLILFIFIFL